MINPRKLLLLGMTLMLLPLEAKALPIEDVQVTSDDKGYEVRLNFLIYEVRLLSASGNNQGEQTVLRLQLINPRSLSTSQLSDLTTTQSATWDTSVNVPLDTIIFQGANDPNNLEVDVQFSRPVHFTAESSPDLREVIIHIDAPSIAQNEKSILPPAVTSVVTVKPSNASSIVAGTTKAAQTPSQAVNAQQTTLTPSTTKAINQLTSVPSNITPSTMVSSATSTPSNPGAPLPITNSTDNASITPVIIQGTNTPSSVTLTSEELAPPKDDDETVGVTNPSTEQVPPSRSLRSTSVEATTAVADNTIALPPSVAVQPVPQLMQTSTPAAIVSPAPSTPATSTPAAITLAPAAGTSPTPVVVTTTTSPALASSTTTTATTVATTSPVIAATSTAATAATAAVTTVAPLSSSTPATVATPVTEATSTVVPEAAPAIEFVPEELKDSLIPANDRENLEKAKQEIIKKHYLAAATIYTNILKSTTTLATIMQATEFRGVAYEKAGLMADARGAYENYVKQFPKSPYISRVQQRLEALLTASDPIRQRLKETVVQSAQPVPAGSGALPSAGSPNFNGSPVASESPTAPAEQPWTNSFSGSLNTQYNFDEFHTKTGGTKTDATVQNGMFEYVDMSDIVRKGTQEYITRLSGSDQTAIGMGHAQGNVSAASIEADDRSEGYVVRLGRQGSSAGGVLGYFDGLFASYDVNPDIKANFVAGLPVDSSHNVPNVNRDFVGVSTDIAAFDKKWNFNLYGIEQLSKGYTDRQAIGGTARTGDAAYSIYGSTEFDINLQALNNVTLNGSYNFPDYHTSVYGTLDYRRTPIAQVTNALIGQPADTLPHLNQLYSISQIDQMAIDRTTFTETGSFGARYEVNKDFQINPSVTITSTGGMSGSFGVAATPSLGTQYTYGLTIVNSNVLMDNDNIVTALNYGQYSYGDSYTASVSDSFPVNDSLNMSMSLNGGYLTSTITPTVVVLGTPGNYRTNLGPSVRADYRYTQSLSFNANASCSWSHDYSAVTPVHTMDQSLTLGMRYSF